MKVNICGIPYLILEREDWFDADTHMGMISYKDAVIRINKDMSDEIKSETICHEVLHGILIHIGREDLSLDEQLVQALANAINQSFAVRIEE